MNVVFLRAVRKTGEAVQPTEAMLCDADCTLGSFVDTL